MKDIILVVCLIAMGVYGYFLMGRLDKFLEENRKTIAKQEAQRKKPYIILKKDASGETVKNEVERFREEHPCACVVVCDPQELEYFNYGELYDA